MNHVRSAFDRLARGAAWLPVIALYLYLTAQPARACSVCYGDPDSDLARGAVQGVIFMIGVVAFVLVSIATVAGVWIARARRLSREIESDAP